MVGQTGAFLYIPLMSRVLRLPLKICVGTTLAVVGCAAVSGLAGKIAASAIKMAWDVFVP